MRAWLYARDLREPPYRLIRDCDTGSCAAASRIKRSREGGARNVRLRVCACVRVRRQSGRDYNAASVKGKGLFSTYPSADSPSRFFAEPRFWIQFSESIIEIVVATSQPGHHRGQVLHPPVPARALLSS